MHFMIVLHGQEIYCQSKGLSVKMKGKRMLFKILKSFKEDALTFYDVKKSYVNMSLASKSSCAIQMLVKFIVFY